MNIHLQFGFEDDGSKAEKFADISAKLGLH